MTLTVASFLAGSLLSMLMPVLLLSTLVVLIHRAIRRIPGGDSSPTRPATQPEAAAPAGASEPALRPPSGDPPVREA
jgi:hypothetical protein